MKKEYRCKYCGGKGTQFCTSCQMKQKLVRILQTMVRNKVKEGKKNGIQKKG